MVVCAVVSFSILKPKTKRILVTGLASTQCPAVATMSVPTRKPEQKDPLGWFLSGSLAHKFHIVPKSCVVSVDVPLSLSTTSVSRNKLTTQSALLRIFGSLIWNKSCLLSTPYITFCFAFNTLSIVAESKSLKDSLGSAVFSRTLNSCNSSSTLKLFNFSIKTSFLKKRRLKWRVCLPDPVHA